VQLSKHKVTHQQINSKMTGNIYISGQIGTFDGVAGVELIDVIGQVKKQPQASAFNVHINSEGGLVDVGFDIYHYLKALGKPITTIGSGIVASIATVIFMAGNQRQVRENTPFMIHLPWGGSMGTANELEQFADQLRAIEKKMVGFYKKALNLQEQALLPLLKNET
jgi:ATP-dependent Clp protease protease subunit